MDALSQLIRIYAQLPQAALMTPVTHYDVLAALLAIQQSLEDLAKIYRDPDGD